MFAERNTCVALAMLYVDVKFMNVLPKKKKKKKKTPSIVTHAARFIRSSP
jgi:hypothetical protein